MKKIIPYSVILSAIYLGACGDDTDGATGSSDCRSDSVSCPLGQSCQGSVTGFLCQDDETLMASNDGSAPSQTVAMDGIANGEAARPEDADEETRAPTVLSPADEDTNEGATTGTEDASMAMTSDEPGASSSEQEPDMGIGVGDGCRAVTLQLKPSRGSVPQFMVVVDRSGSMIDENLWTPLVSTLSTVIPGLEDVISFGLMLFPDPTPPVALDLGIPRSDDPFNESQRAERTRACAPGEVDINPALNNGLSIVEMLETYPARNGMGTPTAPSLEAAGELLARHASTANRYILLATDGGPGCNFALNSQTCDCLLRNCALWDLPENCVDERRSVSVIENLADQGVRTFVLGITSANLHPRSIAVLDAMAVAGRTAVNGRHLSVGAGEELLEQIRQTAGSVAPCEYDLESLAGEVNRLAVAVDETLVSRDQSHVNGWDVVDGDLVFYGDACLHLRDGRAHRITAGCPE